MFQKEKMRYLVLLSIILSGCSRDFIFPFDYIVINDTVNCANSDTCLVGIGLYRIDSKSHDSIFWSCTWGTRENCPIVCNDSNACTNDTYVNGQCVHTPKQLDCNDNNPCTQDFPLWQCPDTVYCIYNSICNVTFCDTADCDDNNVCTWDTCYQSRCYSQRDWFICSDNNPCTVDFCTPNISTQIGYICNSYPLCDDGEPCTVDQCDTTTFLNCDYTDTCFTQCSFDTILTNGDFCKLTVCVDGIVFNTVRQCSDDICINGYCDEVNDRCILIEVDCDDGTGTWYCDSELGCQQVFFKNYIPEQDSVTLFNILGQKVESGYVADGLYLRTGIINGKSYIQKIFIE